MCLAWAACAGSSPKNANGYKRQWLWPYYFKHGKRKPYNLLWLLFKTQTKKTVRLFHKIGIHFWNWVQRKFFWLPDRKIKRNERRKEKRKKKNQGKAKEKRFIEFNCTQPYLYLLSSQQGFFSEIWLFMAFKNFSQQNFQVFSNIKHRKTLQKGRDNLVG